MGGDVREGAGTGGGAGGVRRDRQLAAHALRRARRGVDAMRTFFWTYAVIGLLWSALASGWWRAAGVLFLLLTVAGALRVRTNPFACALAVALFSTALAAAFAVLLATSGETVTDVRIGGLLIWVIGSWYSVRRMKLAEQLMREFPELRETRRMKGDLPQRGRRRR